MINSLPHDLNPDEQLLRAVFPADQRPSFWKNGHLSSAALKDKRGLSVERTYTRTIQESVDYMRQHLTGNVVSISQESCQQVSAVIMYLPSQNNIYHCEIHGSKECVVLDSRQARALARNAELVYSVTVTMTQP